MRNCRLLSLLAFRFVVTPTDLAPVFDAMLDKALRLGAATFGTLLIRDGEPFKIAVRANVANDGFHPLAHLWAGVRQGPKWGRFR